MREGQPIAPAAGATIITLKIARTRRPAAGDPPTSPLRPWALLGLWRSRWRRRREMRHLALFEPDSVLEDVGVSREEAWRRARTPFWRA